MHGTVAMHRSGVLQRRVECDRERPMWTLGATLDPRAYETLDERRNRTRWNTSIPMWTLVCDFPAGVYRMPGWEWNGVGSTIDLVRPTTTSTRRCGPATPPPPLSLSLPRWGRETVPDRRGKAFGLRSS